MSPHHYHHRNPKSLLTPAMHGVLERMAKAGHLPLHALTPTQARAAYTAGAGVLELPALSLARVESFTVRAREGFEVPVRLYAPSDAVLPVLVYFHGGGFTIGSIVTHDTLCRELARLSDCMVVSLAYRLAPEHRFPTASNDAWDALQWLAAPAWMSRKQFNGSAGLLNMRRNSSFSTSSASLADSPSMVTKPASSSSASDISNSSVLSLSSLVSWSSASTTSSSDFFSRPRSCARLGMSQTVGSSSAASTSFSLDALAS